MKSLFLFISLALQTTPPQFVYIEGHKYVVIGYYQEYMHSANCGQCAKQKAEKERKEKEAKAQKEKPKAPPKTPAKPPKLT